MDVEAIVSLLASKGEPSAAMEVIGGLYCVLCESEKLTPDRLRHDPDLVHEPDCPWLLARTQLDLPLSPMPQSPMPPQMRTSDAELVEVLKPLAIDEPWSSSTEGLDDECVFCGAFTPRFVHENDCSWFAAREALGLSTDGHSRGGNSDA